MADLRAIDAIDSVDRVAWTADDLGLTITAAFRTTHLLARDGVPPDPAPLLKTWLAAAGQRLRRTAFAEGNTVAGWTFEETYARAVANLTATPLETAPAERFEGIRVTIPDAAAAQPASLLAVPEVLSKFADDVDGDLLAIAPTRKDLVLAGSAQSDLAELFGFAMVACYAADPAGLSPVPYRISTSQDGTVRVDRWDPGVDSPWYPLYLRARQLELERRYGPMLQYDVGTYTFRDLKAACGSPKWAYDEKTEQLRSYAVWRPWFPTLLPPVDWIGVNLKGPVAAPQLWLSLAELEACTEVETTRTDEFVLPITVASWPGRNADQDDPTLRTALRAAGARTTAKMGGMGEQVHILDWVPGRAGPQDTRFTTFSDFPRMQLPPRS